MCVAFEVAQKTRSIAQIEWHVQLLLLLLLVKCENEKNKKKMLRRLRYDIIFVKRLFVLNVQFIKTVLIQFLELRAADTVNFLLVICDVTVSSFPCRY